MRILLRTGWYRWEGRDLIGVWTDVARCEVDRKGARSGRSICLKRLKLGLWCKLYIVYRDGTRSGGYVHVVMNG